MPEDTRDTILIVDDEESYRLMLRGLLEKKGFRVIEAGDGEAGIETARDRQPDLILMDVNMPRLKGSEAV
ncbi:MAG: response regulator, partial [Planctomycetota bacterium]